MLPLRFTLHQLEYFVAVGEAGSIAKAAEQVNVSPPSISASIAQLEAEFGIQLFVRKHSHGLSLTSGGRVLLKEAIRLLSDAEGLHSIAGTISDLVRGPLAIGCLLTFAQIVLPELRRRFEQQHPEVRIRQYERNQGQLLEMLQRGEIDVALTYDLELSQDFSFKPLVSLPEPPPSGKVNCPNATPLCRPRPPRPTLQLITADVMLGFGERAFWRLSPAWRRTCGAHSVAVQHS